MRGLTRTFRLDDQELGARRALRDGLIVAGVLWAAYGWLVLRDPSPNRFMIDGLAYWSVDPNAPYAQSTLYNSGSFLYSPVAAAVFSVIGRLPEPVFMSLWGLASLALVVWLGRPWPWAWPILLLPISRELMIGQVNVMLTAAIVLGFRWPWLWATVLLTKVTPGLGLLWFAVRREWRKLAIATGVTAALAALSLAISPGWWADWVNLLVRDRGAGAHQLPLVRFVVGCGIVVWGALTDRPWTVPLGAFLGLPVIYPDSFTFLLGCVAVRYESVRRAALGASGGASLGASGGATGTGTPPEAAGQSPADA